MTTFISIRLRTAYDVFSNTTLGAWYRAFMALRCIYGIPFDLSMPELIQHSHSDDLSMFVCWSCPVCALERKLDMNLSGRTRAVA